MPETFGIIYRLSDPRFPNVPRYFGQTTKTLKVRLSAHISEAGRGSRTHVGRWISVLLREGLSPLIHQVSAATSKDELDAQERSAIATGRASGLRLCNITDGGEGHPGPFSPEHRIALSRSHAGKKQSEEQVERRRRAQTGAKRTGIALDNIRAALARPEYRARLSSAQAAAWSEPRKRELRIYGMTIAQNRESVKVKKAAGTAASWANPDVRAQRIASIKDAWRRRREAGLRVTLSDQERTRRSEAARMAWADPDSKQKRLAARQVTYAKQKESING